MRMRKGFTLIELLVVIAIIGILATLVITQVAGAQIRARNSTGKSDINQMGKAIELHKNDSANTSGGTIAAADAAVSTASTITLGSSTDATANAIYFTAIFSGSQSVDNTGNGNTYGIRIAKTSGIGTGYIYSYVTSNGAATQTLKRINATTPCYAISYPGGNTSQGATATPYSIKNSVKADATATCP